MPRKQPSMTIAVDSPIFPATFLRLSESTLATTNATRSPVKRTFLLSPSPSEQSFRIDSPVLPSASRNDLLIFASVSHGSLNSIPTSTAGACPTPHYYSPSLPLCGINTPYPSHWAEAQTAVDGWVTSWPGAARMSDILPDDMDLFPEDEETCFRHWSIVVPDGQQETFIEKDADELELGPEIKSHLPTVHNTDFPYYPLPLYFPPPRQTRGETRMPGLKGRGRRWVKRGVRGFGMKKFLKCVFRRNGVKRV
ncbi:hypothetical protein TW65_03016 [Stemphylium lycopersici]|uniref:Uncharacterized protein n=1 Tax=Stemphylium lycopersici TaxID=183478 RepID=A0A364MVK9_STELY|nr:hypothetical protein TW65_03016 [Stemphylium lycopersici]RAR05017.1 hypothetical protein DDE83_007595 [Stemphylium lycopersici]